ncbi:D-arabinono-1,4-lactone oxidase [Nonomuraea cavernae]|uniref:FAD-linked oxidoreductase n=1 Tax=Nonomuraea cavernae TaxID=2045107 RepID=A0A917YZH8_9ACTN|nr:D-arabinono-1,4-lactone oxidase [Nonomuraea cavernae]MCA2187649.1 FAD-binding protein [Nonomuraea cavernae]GGO70922.1 FAD-linked oxidoreductase [Nonomuraea cavernae]
MVFTNWARNQSATPFDVRTPAAADDVVRAVRDAAAGGRRVRMVGTGHSFTGVALTDGIMLLPTALTGVRSVDGDQVTVLAGTPLKVLNELLDERGLALANMGDITEQTVSGAIQTGTHGTGRDSGGLADQVTALELVLADGSVVTATPGDDLFDAARVGLGALGVLTAVTFRVEPAFLLRNERRRITLSRMLDSLDEMTTGNEHLDFFWLPHTDACLVKTNNRHPGPPRPPSAAKHWLDNVFLENTVFGLACAAGARFPGLIPRINALSAAALGGSEAVDASYRVFTARRDVRFLEMEYAVPRDRLGQALRETRDLVERADWKITFPIEVRVAPPSDAWLSTAYGRPTAYIACHMYRPTPHPAYFAGVEEIMTRLEGRPHWGKLHTRDAAYLSAVYPRFADFVALRDRLDPERLFGNAYLDTVLG